MATPAAPPPVVPQAEVATIATPLNLILLALFMLLVYNLLRKPAAPVFPSAPPPTKLRTFTPRTLRPYNGRDRPEIYIAMKGSYDGQPCHRVFDMTAAGGFYGPDGPYNAFAGWDASRWLATFVVPEDDEIETKKKTLDDSLDTLENLKPDEWTNLREREAGYESKYPEIGRLVAEGSPEV